MNFFSSAKKFLNFSKINQKVIINKNNNYITDEREWKRGMDRERDVEGERDLKFELN